jgi:hypothetical protein
MNAGLNTPTCLPGSTRDSPIFIIPAENSFSISKAFAFVETFARWRVKFFSRGDSHVLLLRKGGGSAACAHEPDFIPPQGADPDTQAGASAGVPFQSSS